MECRTATVTQINEYLKAMFDNNPIIANIWIKGEISNFKRHGSGHLYFSLKDEGGILSAVMFRSGASKVNFVMDNGLKVLARGRITVFAKTGQYQLYVEEIRQDGLGELHIKFEQLKKKLGEEGLFNRKRSIPKFPKAIGIITSETGAALRDMLNILGRRYKIADVYVHPCLVQGQQAAEQIKKAIEYFNRENLVDVLLVGRGGGSIEDLWAFNEEVTARAIFASEIPIISCVGHETDFTIADFVADLRAPTPSAAAELAVPSAAELLDKLRHMGRRRQQALLKLLRVASEKLNRLKNSGALLYFPRRIDEHRYRVLNTFNLIIMNTQARLAEKRHKFANQAIRLDSAGPLRVLHRGYSITLKDGKNVKNIEQVNVGDKLDITVTDGLIKATVDSFEAINGE